MEATLIIGDTSEGTQRLFANWNAHWEYNTLVLSDPISAELKLRPSDMRPFSSIVLAPSDVYPRLDDSLQDAICSFVADGGLLVCLPYTAWSCLTHANHKLQNILPVTVVDHFENAVAEICGDSARLPSGVDREWTNSISSLVEGFRKSTRVVSGEYLQAKADAETLCTIVVNGTQTPLAVSSTFEKGKVLYFNACQHGIRDCDLWSWNWDPSEREGALLECLRVWKAAIIK